MPTDPTPDADDAARMRELLAVLQTSTLGFFPWACDVPTRYEPLRLLGFGGMGSVLLVRDSVLDRLVALKILRETSAAFRDRFAREARLMARLEHPAIVPLHEFGEVGKRCYLTMGYVDGGNLTNARLSPRELIRTIRGVVDALAFAHERGIVHRDVKPQNVLVDSRGRAYLTDFGLAFEPGEDTEPAESDALAGTPLVMSPEQVRGARATPASDVFALGVTLYRMLTGAWPFYGRTVGELLSAIERDQPPRPRTLASGLPRALEAILRRCLAKDPAERFGSMTELGSALDRFLRRQAFFGIASWFARRPDARSVRDRDAPDGDHGSS